MPAGCRFPRLGRDSSKLFEFNWVAFPIWAQEEGKLRLTSYVSICMIYSIGVKQPKCTTIPGKFPKPLLSLPTGDVIRSGFADASCKSR